MSGVVARPAPPPGGCVAARSCLLTAADNGGTMASGPALQGASKARCGGGAVMSRKVHGTQSLQRLLPAPSSSGDVTPLFCWMRPSGSLVLFGGAADLQDVELFLVCRPHEHHVAGEAVRRHDLFQLGHVVLGDRE